MQKRRCYNYGTTASCDARTGSCLACSNSVTGYCVTETNVAAGLSVLYCATSSISLSVVTGTAIRAITSPGGDSGLGDASFVTDSLASPRASGVSAAMSASASSGGLSKGDIAGITIGTVAVVSLIVFGIAFLALRKKKLEAGPRPTEPQAVTPADQPPVGDLRDHARPDIPTWPVEVDGDHEMRHWIPQELDGAETVRRREDGEVQEPKADATLVSPIQDDVDGVDHEHNKT